MKHIRFLRGLPGSGLSTLATEMLKNERAFLISDQEYDDDNHGAQRKAAELMHMGFGPIVLDQCNIMSRTLMPFAQLANYYEYNWSVIDIDTPWRLDVKELVKKTKKSNLNIIESLKFEYLRMPTEALNVILRCEPPVDPDKILRQAQIAIEDCKYSRVDECIFDYRYWRSIGGFIPAGGDDLANSLVDKLLPWQEKDFCI